MITRFLPSFIPSLAICMEPSTLESYTIETINEYNEHILDELLAEQERYADLFHEVTDIALLSGTYADLFRAISRNERGKVSLMLNDYPELAHANINCTDTPLILASFFGNDHIVDQLLTYRIDINAQSLKTGGTALHALIEGRSVLPPSLDEINDIEQRRRIVRSLVHNAINTELLDNNNETAQQVAVRMGQYILADEIVSSLKNNRDQRGRMYLTQCLRESLRVHPPIYIVYQPQIIVPHFYYQAGGY